MSTTEASVSIPNQVNSNNSFLLKTAVVLFGVLFVGLILIFSVYFLMTSGGQAEKEYFYSEGTASRQVAPDSVSINLGVRERGQDTEILQADGNKKVTAFVNELKASGIKAEQIKTNSYSLYPYYDPEFKGDTFEFYNNIEIKLEATNPSAEDVSNILKIAQQQKLSELNGVYFYLSDNSPIWDELEEEAIEDAKETATRRAVAAGLRLGKVVNIGGSDMPFMIAERGFGEMDMAAEAPVQMEEEAPSLFEDTFEENQTSLDQFKGSEDPLIQPGQIEARKNMTLTYLLK